MLGQKKARSQAEVQATLRPQQAQQQQQQGAAAAAPPGFHYRSQQVRAPGLCGCVRVCVCGWLAGWLCLPGCPHHHHCLPFCPALLSTQCHPPTSAALPAPSPPPLPCPQMPIGRARLEELRQQLAGTQERVRAAVAAEQEEILGMPERKYKNMLRSHRSQRIEMARKVGGWVGGWVGGAASGIDFWVVDRVYRGGGPACWRAAATTGVVLQPAWPLPSGPDCRQLRGLTRPICLPALPCPGRRRLRTRRRWVLGGPRMLRHTARSSSPSAATPPATPARCATGVSQAARQAGRQPQAVAAVRHCIMRRGTCCGARTCCCSSRCTSNSTPDKTAARPRDAPSPTCTCVPCPPCLPCRRAAGARAAGA